MIRLFWKEAREQLWFIIAALAAPVVIAIWRTLLHSPGWPQSHADLLLIYAVFVVWGARSVPGERGHGRLTLATIPVPRWDIWLAKCLPAMLVAFVAAAVTWQFANTYAYYLTPGLVAAVSALCFSAGFLLGIAASAPVAALQAVVVVCLGMAAVNRVTPSDSSSMSRGIEAAVAEPLIWAEIAVILLAAFTAIAWRGGIASPRKARWSVALGVLAVALPGVAALLDPGRRPAPTHSWFAGGPVVSRATNWVAFLDDFPKGWPHIRQNPIYSDTGLWVMRPDGSERRLVSGRVMPQPIVWLGTGELLYIERDVLKETDRYMAWSPNTGKSRFVLEVPLGQIVSRPQESSAEGWGASWVAPEPRGTRFACFRRSQSRLPSDGYDLWLVDSRTGKATLLVPWVDANAVYWRAGRVYLSSYNEPRSISPSGGPLREETQLPPPDKEESR